MTFFFRQIEIMQGCILDNITESVIFVYENSIVVNVFIPNRHILKYVGMKCYV